jgi:uncharacterized protein (DUF1501 family)
MPIENFTSHKFIIFAFKLGGEDTYQTIMPRDGTRAAQLRSWRPTLGFTDAELNNANGSGGVCELSRLDADFVMHPRLEHIKAIWDAGDMALVHRVGNQWTPVASNTQAEIQNSFNVFLAPTTGIIHPFGLGGHDAQTYQAATQVSNNFTDGNGRAWSMVASGFGGRMAERFAPYIGSSALPMMQMFGKGIFQDHWPLSQTQQRISLPRFGQSFGLNQANNATMTAMLEFLNALNTGEPAEVRDRISRNAYNTTREAATFYGPVVATAKGTGGPLFAVDAPFPAFSGANQVWQGSFLSIARAIERRLTGGGTPQPFRTAFAVGWPDWDTHDAQGKLTGRLPDNHEDWARGVRGFRDAMVALGIWNDVLIVDMSEFARTLPENGGLGTDHAWSRSCFLFGGAVKGLGKSGSTGHYGDFPSSIGAFQNGSHDVHGGQIGLGSIKPLYSWEEHLDPALRWFGCTNDDIAEILPRRAVFGASPDYLV